MLTLCLKTNAQQDPMYTQYMHNQQTINPGYVGSNDMLSVMIMSRQQWVGFDGAPRTNLFSMNSKLRYFNVGTGFTFINDKIGPTEQNSFYGDISYHLRLGYRTMLGMGLKAGFDMLQLKLNDLNLDQNNDSAFAENFNQNFILNFGVGLYLYNPKYYIGLASPRLMRNQYDNDGVSSASKGYKERHYFLNGGALFNINHNLKFKPSALAKIVYNAPISIDISANFIYLDRFWFGASHRIDDSFSVMLQYQMTNKWRIGYAFDMTGSELRKYNSGTHEVMIAFDFHLGDKKILTPRFF
jgi:type IX secretion system PorP/SprF family membrane protein